MTRVVYHRSPEATAVTASTESTAWRTVPIVCLMAAGCAGGDGHEYLVSYQIETAEVRSYDYDRVCRGRLDAIDAENLRIRDAVGAPDQFPVVVSLGERAVDLQCEFGRDLNGCAFRADGTIYAVAAPGSLLHELVHAQRQQEPRWRKPSFLEEGAAEIFKAGGLAPYNTLTGRQLDLSDAFELPSSEMTLGLHREASHFLFFLIEAFGSEPVDEMLRSFEPDGRKAAEAAFGLSLEELQQRWHDESEDRYKTDSNCAVQAEDWGGSLKLAFDMRCDSSSVFGPAVGLSGVTVTTTTSCFHVPALTKARIELQAEMPGTTVRITPIDQDCDKVDNGEMDKVIVAGEVLEASFAACRWQIIVNADIEEVRPVELGITEVE